MLTRQRSDTCQMRSAGGKVKRGVAGRGGTARLGLRCHTPPVDRGSAPVAGCRGATQPSGAPMSDPEITREENDSKGRYMLRQEGGTAELTYSRLGGAAIIIDHTAVPDALRRAPAGRAGRRRRPRRRPQDRAALPLYQGANRPHARVAGRASGPLSFQNRSMRYGAMSIGGAAPVTRSAISCAVVAAWVMPRWPWPVA